jgi:hypothetical protein
MGRTSSVFVRGVLPEQARRLRRISRQSHGVRDLELAEDHTQVDW